MAGLIKRIVVVGGGSAGWLAAAIIAAERSTNSNEGITLTLIESPGIAAVGVGEGTWPSMRETLRKIGVSEAEFIIECNASFKQGSKFVGWSAGSDEYFYHPFTLPAAYGDINLVPHWRLYREKVSFADAVCPQGYVCDKGLAPKQIATPEFAYNLNYGYHLDAGKFSDFIRRHSVEKLGVLHVQDDVVGVESKDNGDISSLTLKSGKRISGDLFIDCTGFSSLLIGGHYQIRCIDKKNILFNDSALTVPVSYREQHSPISSCTTGTAQSNGWIWDIGLSNRRGIGHVYSSSHTTEDAAQKELKNYLSKDLTPEELDALPIRKIQFSPGHREIFWHKNCVAIGLSAGFVEPLEATALVLTELSAQMVAEELPATREVMTIVARRFNKRFSQLWDKSIDFLKMHYVLSSRTDTDYWNDHSVESSVPDSLREFLMLWENRPPWIYDSTHRGEMFPSASFQYVLYGMRPETTTRQPSLRNLTEDSERAKDLFQENVRKTQRFMAGLPTNRELIEKIKQTGFHKH
jgi:tryptophan halogenase